MDGFVTLTPEAMARTPAFPRALAHRKNADRRRAEVGATRRSKRAVTPGADVEASASMLHRRFFAFGAKKDGERESESSARTKTERESPAEMRAREVRLHYRCDGRGDGTSDEALCVGEMRARGVRGGR